MARTILLDTNLLLVLVAGYAARGYLGRQIGLKDYSERDFEVLLNAIALSDTLLTTPNIVTEMWSLIGRMGSEDARRVMREQLKIILDYVDERYVPSRSVAARKHFAWLGVTDTGLLMLEGDVCIWTADDNLYDAALRGKLDVVNLKHLPHRFR